MEVGWFLRLLICVGRAGTTVWGWLELFDKTTNYDSHPSRGTVLFVKAILTTDCDSFMFYTVSSKWQFRSTPTILYEKTAHLGQLTFKYDYSSLGFASSGSHKREDIVSVNVALFPNGFSFTLSFVKSKVYLIFNGRLFFMDTAEIMLLDDHDYKSYFEKSRPAAFVTGCTSSKQRVIIRKSLYMGAFNYATVHWPTNQRALGPIVAGNTIICNVNYFSSPSGSFELGAYGESGYARNGMSVVRSFMGLTLNHDFGRDVNVVFVAKHGEYDPQNYERVKDFGYDVEVGDNAHQFSISMEFVSNSRTKEHSNITTDILYVVTGSAHLSVKAPCATRAKAPIVCDPRSTDFYFTALRLGHARRKHEESITNRTWSRCALHGPSKYRDILDRSQRLTLTYSFYEDLGLMRQHDQRKASSVTQVKGERVP